MASGSKHAHGSAQGSNVFRLPVAPITNGAGSRQPLATKAIIRTFPRPAAPTLPQGDAKRVRIPGGAPSPQQKRWLKRGLDQAGGKLPLFDEYGQRISERTVKTCLDRGWAEPWFANPVKPDWLVCRLTDLGRAALA